MAWPWSPRRATPAWWAVAFHDLTMPSTVRRSCSRCDDSMRSPSPTRRRCRSPAAPASPSPTGNERHGRAGSTPRSTSPHATRPQSEERSPPMPVVRESCDSERCANRSSVSRRCSPTAPSPGRSSDWRRRRSVSTGRHCSQVPRAHSLSSPPHACASFLASIRSRDRVGRARRSRRSVGVAGHGPATAAVARLDRDHLARGARPGDGPPRDHAADRSPDRGRRRRDRMRRPHRPDDRTARGARRRRRCRRHGDRHRRPPPPAPPLVPRPHHRGDRRARPLPQARRPTNSMSPSPSPRSIVSSTWRELPPTASRHV